jgi:SHS2 domain-containing protein
MIEIESHIADIRIRLEADSLEHLFSEGMKSLYDVLQPRRKKGKSSVVLSINLNGSDITVLLIDFLNEVLSYSLINKCVYDKILIFNLSGDNLLVELKGFTVAKFLKDVKAVTFHEAEVVESGAGIFETMIILDI